MAFVFLAVLLIAPLLAAGAPATHASTASSGWNDRYAIPLADLAIARLSTAVAAAGADLVRVDDRLGFAVVQTTAPDRLATLLGVPLVPDEEGRGAWVPNDPSLGSQWALDALDMPAAWDVQRGDRAVWVADVDSGVDMHHEDLRGVAFRTGFDYVGKDLDPSDAHGHGTHIAGTIAADTDNAIGIAGMADVGIIVIRVLDAQNRGSCLDFASGIAEAVALGADVINLSLYCTSTQAYLTAAVLLADEADVVVVAAAGNFWADRPSSCVTTPARLPNVIAVAAVEKSLSAAPYSCRGAEVELAAPGSAILATLPGNTYGSWYGTSMATPHVAATAALILSHGDLSADEVRSILQASAMDLGEAGRDATFGYGLIDPANALALVPGQTPE